MSHARPDLEPADELAWSRLVAFHPMTEDLSSGARGSSGASETASGAKQMPNSAWPDILQESRAHAVR